MSNSLPIRRAVSLLLSSLEGSVLSDYGFGLRLFRLLVGEDPAGLRVAFRGEPVPAKRHYVAALSFARDYGLLSPVQGVPPDRGFLLLGRTIEDSAAAYCALDPFCQVSHLSAMALHGITDRRPQLLLLSAPSPTEWRRLAAIRMEGDLGPHWQAYRTARFPQLRPLALGSILGTPVRFVTTREQGGTRSLPGRGEAAVRLTTIGRTFLDMLRAPELCGGIHHVLDVFRNHAGGYLPNIIDEVSRRGEPIDKVRAGYVLDEVCGLSGEVPPEWQTHVARGGSRRLVGKAPFSSRFSARWCLSLNEDEA
jgi:hypothetical protein